MTLLVPLMFQSHRVSLSCYTISYLWVCCLCCSFLSEIVPFAPMLMGSPYSPILFHLFIYCIVQSLSHVWLCDPMDCSMPGFPVLHRLPEFAQTHVHWVDDAIQPSHLLLSPSPPVFNLSQWGSFPMSWLFVSFIYMSSQLRSPQLHLKYVNWFSLKIYMFFNSVPHLFPS